MSSLSHRKKIALSILFYLHAHAPSHHKRHQGFASRIRRKVAAIGRVFLQCPQICIPNGEGISFHTNVYRHTIRSQRTYLPEGDEEEDIARERLSHDCKREPGGKLPCVVGTRDKGKQIALFRSEKKTETSVPSLKVNTPIDISVSTMKCKLARDHIKNGVFKTK